MPDFRSLGAFGEAINDFADELEREVIKRMTAEQAAEAQRIAEREASADLGGDPKMSGWEPSLDTKVIHFPDGASLLAPTRSSAGPWTVATLGRNQGNAGGLAGPGVIQSGANAGTTARTKSGGVRKVRARKLRRWNGYTDGKGTGDRVHDAATAAAQPIAEKWGRLAAEKRFDVD